jgi:hypothetical protein
MGLLAVVSAHKLASGDPAADTVFDYGPAFGDQQTLGDCSPPFAEPQAALKWLSSENGKAWVAESTNYFLLTLYRFDSAS